MRDEQFLICREMRVLQRKEDAIADKIIALRERCTHPNATLKYGSNTGNYDPSADCYWTDYACPDCGKKWTVFK